MSADYIYTKIIDDTAGPNIAYLLKEDDMLYDIGFRVIENQNDMGVLPGYKLRYNGKIKFIFFTEQFVSLKDIIFALEEQDILTVVNNLSNVVQKVIENGFLNIACVDARLERIWVDKEDLSVKLTYLPLNIEVKGNHKAEFEQSLSACLRRELLVFENRYSEKFLSIIKNENFIFNNLLQSGKDVVNKCEREKASCNRDDEQFMVKYILVSAKGDISIPINKSEFIVGKSIEKADGVISNNSAISRVHCKFIYHNEKCFIEDMGSANGTFVEQRKIGAEERVEIHNGSSIRIANADFYIRGEIYE